MGFTQTSLRRAFAPAVLLLALTAGTLAPPTNAEAATATIPDDALPTVQIDGVVWTQIVVGNTVYAGGSFSTVRDAGAALGSGTAQPYLVAYNVETGQLITSFRPTLNGQVRGLAPSADGSTIYAVGDFTAAGGQTHQHVAALSAATGAPVAGFDAQLNSSALAVTATSDTVWVGGTFTSADGVGRSRAAAFDAGTGALTSWAPQVGDYTVRALEVAPDRSKILLAGSFTTINGAAAIGMGAVSATTGASLPWAANTVVQDSGSNSAIFSLSARGSVVYATGYSYATNGGTGNLEGAVAMNWSDGSIKWIENCNGDTYDSVVFDGALYTVSHAHDCTYIGGFSETTPETYHRSLAFSLEATQKIPTTSPWFGTLPAPSLLDWDPNLHIGTYTGMAQAAWSAAQGDGYLVLGGEFTAVNGVAQQGLVRFKGQPDGSDPVVTDPTPTPTPSTSPSGPSASGSAVPKQVGHPAAIALGASGIAVRWSAPKAGSASKVTGYVVRAYKGSKLVKTLTVGATKRLATITGLKKSTTYKIGVAAKNAQGTGKLSSFDSAKTKAKGKNVSATNHPTKVKKPSTTVGKGKVRVRWKGASAKGALAITKYQVRFLKAGKTVKVVTVSAATRSRLVTKLARKSAYTVSVRAYNWAGWGSWSTGKSVRTR